MATILANSFAPQKPSEPPDSQSRRLPAPLRYWHLASLDAPTVAVVWGWAFAWAAHVQLAIWPLALLGLVVWVIYVGDRLLDARAGLNPLSGASKQDLRERHYFHWRHRRILAPLGAIAGLAAAWIVHLRVPAIALPQDSVVAAATLAYFSGVHTRLKLPAQVGRALTVFGSVFKSVSGSVFESRECLVGALFAAGCVLPAWSMDPVWNGATSPARLLLLPATYFSALAWLNVRAITHWESQRNGLRLGRVAWGLAALGLLLAAGLLPAQPRASALVAAGAGSALLIGWLDWRREKFNLLTLRVAVDLVLLTPLLLAAAALLARS